MGAVKELWWVIIMIGGPALTAVLWEKWDQKRKDDHIFKTVEEARNDFA